jgi:predicted nucleic acid-binding protein
MNYSPISSAVVIDANIAIRAVILTKQGLEAQKVEEWQQTGVQFLVPDIWSSEITSAIRQIIYINVLTEEEGQKALHHLFAMNIMIIPADEMLCQAALAWASRLSQSKAYDGFYLALAERLSDERGRQVEFWTADERLYNRARQVGAPSIRWIGEMDYPGAIS